MSSGVIFGVFGMCCTQETWSPTGRSWEPTITLRLGRGSALSKRRRQKGRRKRRKSRSRDGFQVSRGESRPVGRLSFGRGSPREMLLLLDGEGFGEFEAEGGLGGQDNLVPPGVGRSRRSRTGTQCGADEGAFAATGKTADEGRGTFALALQGA